MEIVREVGGGNKGVFLLEIVLLLFNFEREAAL